MHCPGPVVEQADKGKARKGPHRPSCVWRRIRIVEGIGALAARPARKPYVVADVERRGAALPCRGLYPRECVRPDALNAARCLGARERPAAPAAGKAREHARHARAHARGVEPHVILRVGLVKAGAAGFGTVVLVEPVRVLHPLAVVQVVVEAGLDSLPGGPQRRDADKSAAAPRGL